MDIEIKKILEDSNAEIKSAIESKASAAEIVELKTRLAAMETALARPTLLKSNEAEQAMVEYKNAVINYLRSPYAEAKSALKAIEAKSLNTVTGAAGGFTVPTQILPGIANEKVKVSAIRRLAEVVVADSQNVSKVVETSGFGFEWVSETGVRSETTTPVYSSRVPTFGILAAKAPVTYTMLEDSAFDIYNEVMTGLFNGFYKGESISFISGDGTNKPTGLLNGTTIGTVASGNATSIVSADALLDLIAAVDSGYHNGAVFLMNSKTKTAISKLKNSEGDYIFKDAIVAGTTSTLWGFPVEIDENMPDIAAGAKPVLFGNFYDGYLIADRGSMSIIEDHVTNLGYVQFIGRKRVGGIVKDARALKALVIAAS